MLFGWSVSKKSLLGRKSHLLPNFHRGLELFFWKTTRKSSPLQINLQPLWRNVHFNCSSPAALERCAQSQTVLMFKVQQKICIRAETKSTRGGLWSAKTRASIPAGLFLPTKIFCLIRWAESVVPLVLRKEKDYQNWTHISGFFAQLGIRHHFQGLTSNTMINFQLSFLFLQAPEKRPCEYCGKEFLRLETLKAHIAVQHTAGGKTRFRCGRCGRRFSQKGALKVHQNNPRACQRDFEMNHSLGTNLTEELLPDETNLAEEVNNVTEEVTTETSKPHKCDECGKSLATLGGLEVHKRKHTG